MVNHGENGNVRFMNQWFFWIRSFQWIAWFLVQIIERFIKIFLCVPQKNLIQVWNDMWVSKWQHFHFCLNYSFNIIWQECNHTSPFCFYPILFQFKITSFRIVTSYLEYVDSMRKLHPENTTNIFTADVNKIWLTL